MNKVEILKELRDAKENRGSGEETTGALYLNVLIRDKKFRMYCGDGRQTIRWLTDNAIFKYEAYREKNDRNPVCGIAFGVKLEDGSMCDLDEKIKDVVGKNDNLLVLLKEENEVLNNEYSKKVEEDEMEIF